MSETATREWLFYLDDMLTFAEKVLSYTEGFEQQQFIDCVEKVGFWCF
ncbi:hypothetical protein [Methylomonas methanica]|nr:hypothetical protein [Methylomonas methanica]